MLEKMKRQSPPKDSWLAFTFRCLAAISLLILSFCSQAYVDDIGRSIYVRSLALLSYGFGLSLAFMWLFQWARHADEYQRLLIYRNLFITTISVVMTFILIHIANVFDTSRSNDWPIMAMPAYGILLAVLGSRPKKI